MFAPPVSDSSLQTIASMQTGTHAWCWVAGFGSGATMVVVEQSADPKAAQFAHRVGQLLQLYGEPDAAVRGMLTRLPSGAYSLSFREPIKTVAPLYETLYANNEQLPPVTLVRMEGTRIMKGQQCGAPRQQAATDDIWGALF